MCSYLAVSKTVKTSVGLGLAVVFALGNTVPANFMLENYVLKEGALTWIDDTFLNVDLSFLSFILFIAVSGTTAQTLLNSALKRGELSFLLPLDFLRLIWSVLLGIALFGESTSVFLWLGGLFILSATTLIVTSERKNQLL